MVALAIQATSLQFGSIGLSGPQGSQPGSDFQACLGAHHHHHHHHHFDKGVGQGPDGQQPWQTSQNMQQPGMGRSDQMPTSNAACPSTDPTNGQNCTQSDSKQPGQAMIQAGEQMVQAGQQAIQQGHYRKGMELINQGMNLINQGASQLASQQPPQATNPLNQSPASAPSVSNNGQSNPFSLISQFLQLASGTGSSGGGSSPLAGLLGACSGLLGGGGSSLGGDLVGGGLLGMFV